MALFSPQLDTFRHREHCGPNFDDDLDYRSKNEVELGFINDPVLLEKIVN